MVLLVLLCCAASVLYMLACTPRATTSAWEAARAKRPTEQEPAPRRRCSAGRSVTGHVGSLKRQIAQLQDELQERSENAEELRSSSERPAGARAGQADLLAARSQVDRERRCTPASSRPQYAAVPFDSFPLHKVYQLETGLTRHPEEKPCARTKRDELVEAISRPWRL